MDSRRPGRRPWLVGILVVVALLLVAGNGGRAWWARRVGDLTNGSRWADFLIGLVVGLLPVIAVGVASLARGRRRVLRMFVAGALGFVATDLLAPSLWKAITNNTAATRPFETHTPGYLPGVYVGIGIWVVLLVLAYVRIRRALRRHLHRYGGPYVG
jgi:zinc transporter ZupT